MAQAAGRLEAWLARHWWQAQPTALARLLWPLSLLYRGLLALHRRIQPPPQALPVPLLVVGNHVVGGAGKTPAVMAMVQALQQAGHRPGVVSRGHGRQGSAVHAVQGHDDAATAGDEPLLMRRRCGVPVCVGARRADAARALCAAHPEVDVLVADDGLQHRALARNAELVVFDERGAGNGLLLPAGPLRNPLPHTVPRNCRVLYTSGQASTVLPGALALRSMARAVPLTAWSAGRDDGAVELIALQQRPLLAVAGIAAPEKFFTMLRRASLTIQACPLPDHHPYATLPWPLGTADVITTEKDAIKLDPRGQGTTRVWVVPLDLTLPPALVIELLGLLFPAP